MTNPKSSTSPTVRSASSLFARGFTAAIFLTFACLCVASVYLFMFMNRTSTSIDHLLESAKNNDLDQSIALIALNTNLGMAKITLLSCGVFCGMAFGFLGVALFLFGIKDAMDITAEGGGMKLVGTRVAPGIVVILCATLLIAVSVYSPLKTSIETKPPDVPHETLEQRGDGTRLPTHENLGSMPGSQEGKVEQDRVAVPQKAEELTQ